MRTTLAIAFTSLLALSAPAFAQSPGSPGATGTGMTGSGANTPGSGAVHPGDPAPGYQTRDNGMSEGRAAAPDEGMNPAAQHNANEWNNTVPRNNN
jgi:hypothetical protein